MNDGIKRMDFLDSLESGRFLWLIMPVVLLLFILAAGVSVVDLGKSELITVYKKQEQEKYHVKKVSSIPEKDRAKEEAKKEDEEKNLGESDVRNRYVSYLVSRIQACKVYPLQQQKQGHQGSVLLKVYIGNDGKVQKVGILRPARYQALTDAAVASIQRANPFHPFPPALEEEQMIVKVEVQFRLD